MKKANYLSTIKSLLLLTFIMIMTSCGKDDPAVVPVTACFEDSYNGTYKGNDQSSPDEVTVKMTKTSCTTAKLESTILGNKNIKELNASGPGGYSGKLDNGTNVSLAFTNSNMSVSCEGYNFSGAKQ